MHDYGVLYLPRKGGKSLYEHAALICEQTGKWPDDIPEPPEIPYGFGHVWAAFFELRGAIPSGFNGMNPITFTDMQAWNAITGSNFQAWHFSLLRLMDSTYLQTWNELRPQK